MRSSPTSWPRRNAYLRAIAAQRERARRELARRRLVHFTTYTYPQYRPEAAHELIAERLEAVLRGDSTRLMIFAPPQHGKSELASVRFPAFWLAQRPADPVILCSYAASLAYSKSREARATVESPAFQMLFPAIETRRDSRAVDYWRLAGQRGGMLAAGVGGPITGHGAQLGVIDDPIENWAQAQSLTIRDKVWSWYRTTFRTRIWERGAIVLIMTRWHEDDLAGRLLQDQGEQWEVLRLPALSEGPGDPLGRAEGEPLCPGRFSQEALEGIRRDVGSMAWAAEYQGTPRAPEGNRFKRDWFAIADAAPAEAVRCRFWDLAATEGAGDYTVGLRLARAGDTYIIEDVVRGQWNPGQRDRIIKQTAQLDGPEVLQRIEQEPGSAGVSVIAGLVRLLAGFAVAGVRSTGDKVVRAEPFAAQCEAGNVRLQRGPWVGAFLEEICSFPQGSHDDQVDAASGAFGVLSPGGGSLLLWEE